VPHLRSGRALSHPHTTSHIQPGGLPQGPVLSCCCSVLTPHDTSGTPAASSATCSRPCCPDYTCSAEKETRHTPYVLYGRRPRFSLPLCGKMVWQPRHIRQPPHVLTPSGYRLRLSPPPIRGSQTLLGALPCHLTFPYPSPPVSLFLIPHCPKNKPGHRLPGRAVRVRKALLQHKSVRQATVVSPKVPHRSQLLTFVSLPHLHLQLSRTILSS